MNIILWVLQVLLAVAFLAHGWLYLGTEPESRDRPGGAVAQFQSTLQERRRAVVFLASQVHVSRDLIPLRKLRIELDRADCQRQRRRSHGRRPA